MTGRRDRIHTWDKFIFGHDERGGDRRGSPDGRDDVLTSDMRFVELVNMYSDPGINLRKRPGAIYMQHNGTQITLAPHASGFAEIMGEPVVAVASSAPAAGTWDAFPQILVEYRDNDNAIIEGTENLYPVFIESSVTFGDTVYLAVRMSNGTIAHVYESALLENTMPDFFGLPLVTAQSLLLAFSTKPVFDTVTPYNVPWLVTQQITEQTPEAGSTVDNPAAETYTVSELRTNLTMREGQPRPTAPILEYPDGSPYQEFITHYDKGLSALTTEFDGPTITNFSGTNSVGNPNVHARIAIPNVTDWTVKSVYLGIYINRSLSTVITDIGGFSTFIDRAEYTTGITKLGITPEELGGTTIRVTEIQLQVVYTGPDNAVRVMSINIDNPSTEIGNVVSATNGPLPDTEDFEIEVVADRMLVGNQVMWDVTITGDKFWVLFSDENPADYSVRASPFHFTTTDNRLLPAVFEVVQVVRPIGMLVKPVARRTYILPALGL